MKKVKCENGHFYDADRYDVCPLCGKQSSEVLVQRNLQSDPDATVKLPESTVLDDFVAEEQLDIRSVAPVVDEIAPDEPAEGIGEILGGETPPKERSAPAGVQPQFPSLNETVTASNAAAVPVLPPRVKKSDSREAVLPVGWIVRLNGTSRGKVFFCKAGRNHIGSGRNMDIVLTDECSVNQNTHAIIIYEPKKRQFFVQVGIGDELPYLNGERVFTHEELHAYDRITLGEAEFLFLPLCGDSFAWDENIHGE